MTGKKISQQHQATVDGIRHTDEEGNEYWLARELAPLLEYVQWRNFMLVVDKARMACQQAGNPVADHFADISKMVGIGSGARRSVDEAGLSCHASPVRPELVEGPCVVRQAHHERRGVVRQAHHERRGVVRQAHHERRGVVRQAYHERRGVVRQAHRERMAGIQHARSWA